MFGDRGAESWEYPKILRFKTIWSELCFTNNYLESTSSMSYNCDELQPLALKRLIHLISESRRTHKAPKITYGEMAKHLTKALDRENTIVNPQTIGRVLGRMMGTLWRDHSEFIPPINVFVVSQRTRRASRGADYFVENWLKKQNAPKMNGDKKKLKYIWRETLKFKNLNKLKI